MRAKYRITVTDGAPGSGLLDTAVLFLSRSRWQWAVLETDGTAVLAAGDAATREGASKAAERAADGLAAALAYEYTPGRPRTRIRQAQVADRTDRFPDLDPRA